MISVNKLFPRKTIAQMEKTALITLEHHLQMAATSA